MRADGDECRHLILFVKNCPIVSCHVNASAPWEGPLHGMIVQRDMQRIPHEQIQSFKKLPLNFLWQFLKFLFKRLMETNFHISYANISLPRSPSCTEETCSFQQQRPSLLVVPPTAFL